MPKVNYINPEKARMDALRKIVRVHLAERDMKQNELEKEMGYKEGSGNLSRKLYGKTAISLDDLVKMRRILKLTAYEMDIITGGKGA